MVVYVLRFGFTRRFRRVEPIQNALLLQQSAGCIGRLRAMTEPAQGLIRVYLNSGWVYARIVMPNGVDEATITRLGAVSDNDAVEGAFFSSHSLQSNLDWQVSAPFRIRLAASE